MDQSAGDKVPAVEQASSLDDILGALVAEHGEQHLAEANQWVADALYPEHIDAPTIAVLRLKAGLTQRGLAEKMGVKQPYIARIEGGQENITFTTLANLASALDIDIGTAAAALQSTYHASAERHA
jgi:DNA-binding XRE family transcriptional regulator